MRVIDFTFFISVMLIPCVGRGGCRWPVTIIPGQREYTNDFYFSASSTEGAPGEVVGVELSLTIEQFHEDYLDGAGLVAAYDPTNAEVLGEPVYSEGFWEFGYSPFYISLAETEGLKGFIIFFPTRMIAEPDPSNFLGVPISIGTIYFRLRGVPGDTFEVKFLDNVLAGGVGQCVQNQLSYSERSTGRGKLTTYSTGHMPGLVRIVDREPIRTEPPLLPPDAKVYPEPPTNESAGVRYELSGGTARPGDKVSVDLFITSSYDFVGYVAAGKFPSEYLGLERIEILTTPGIQMIDNEKGQFGFYSTNSMRRMGAEGERVHAARMYFQVKVEAGAVGELRIVLEDLTRVEGIGKSYENRVRIRQAEVPHLTPTVDIAPLVLTGSVLEVRSDALTTRGDVNFDSVLDLTDVVLLLGYLLLGGDEPKCQIGADFNVDGRLDIADPIAMISTLFFGAARPEGPREVPCN